MISKGKTDDNQGKMIINVKCKLRAECCEPIKQKILAQNSHSLCINNYFHYSTNYYDLWVRKND